VGVNNGSPGPVAKLLGQQVAPLSPGPSSMLIGHQQQQSLGGGRRANRTRFAEWQVWLHFVPYLLAYVIENLHLQQRR